ncbi:MAG: GAF domain-containing protein, partial [Myxococcales bacterium]|nr:GAF domain-containing protein [Myxococcales bacterium]
MRRFRNLSIGGKITTSVAIVIVLEVLIAVVGLYYVRDLRGEIDTLVDVGAERIKLAARLNRNFYQLATLTGELLVATSSSRRSVVTKAIAARKAEAYGRIEQLRKIAATSDLETLASFGVIFRDYLSLVEQIRGLMEQGRSLDAARLADTRASRLIALGTELLERLVDRQDRGLDDAKRASARRADIGTTVIVVLMALSTLLGLGFGVIVARMIAGDLNRLVGVANNIASGNLDNPIVIDGADETGQLASAVDTMQRSLRQAREESEAKIWLENGLGRLNAVVRGEQAIETIATNVIREIAETLDAKIGAFYAMAEHGGERELRLLGSYAYTRRKNLSSRFAIGEGLVGQAALERQPIVIRNAPEDYLTIASGLGEGRPHFICVTPFEHDDDVKGVIEVGSFGELGEKQTDYLERAMPIIAVTLQSALGRQALAQSLERAQQLTEELQVQQEELRASNEELEEQTMALRQSEERLKAQQEELEVMNVELEEKNELLERQKRAVEVARSDISAKAEQLAQASKYKSEFLANMSHELRTPLNSLLILSRVFADNREGNLTDDQVESARVIYNSGTDLLGLINDILDLAKIEAGRMDLQLGRVALRDLSSTILDSFQHIAEEKGIELRVEIGAGAPGELVTDRKRLHQVLKNLISNAIKFTEVGGATVTFGPVPADRTLTRSDLARSEALAIAVRDTGIGIPHDKQQLIFEAFQQVEGGTTRKYGGTGLGLSITREIVQLLGGEIHVESEPGQGTTFLVVLPTQLQTTEVQPTRQSGSSRLGGSPDSGAAGRSTQVREIARVPDDRGNLADDETAILIIDDDPTFAALLARKCHEQG